MEWKTKNSGGEGTDQGREIITGSGDHFALETKSLKDVPIFAAGTWTSSQGRKRKWTIADLDKIVANTKALAGRIIPYLRVDHTDAKTHKRIAGRFKIGDIENVRRVREKLVGDFVRVPKKAWELMEAGVFGRPSAEIVPTFYDENSNKTFGPILWGAAVLSGSHPAVTTLDEIRNLFGLESSEPVEAYTIGDTDLEIECFHTHEDEGGEDVTKEEVQKMLDEGLAKEREATAQKFSKITDALGIEADADAVAAITDLKKDRDDKATAITEGEKRDFTAKVDAVITQAKKDKKLLPRDEGDVRDLVAAWQTNAEDGKVSFKNVKGEAKTGSVIERLEAHFEGRKVLDVNTTEAGSEGDPKEKGKTMGKVVPRHIQEYSDREGIPIDPESVEIAEKMQEFSKHNPNASAEEAYCAVTDSDMTPEPKTDVGTTEA